MAWKRYSKEALDAAVAEYLSGTPMTKCSLPMSSVFKALRKRGIASRSSHAYHKTPNERFDESYTADTHTGCWIWTRLKSRGYGIITVNRRNKLAHRFSYERYVGSIPDGMHVCHRCDVPACVNPAHLFVGTQRDNMNDMDSKGRRGTWTPSGERNPNSKLTYADAQEIRRRHASGVATRLLAAEYAIDRSHVQGIVAGRVWRTNAHHSS